MAAGRFSLLLALEVAFARRAVQIDTDMRVLIRQMSLENSLWGAPRIQGELLKLGFDVAQSSVAKYIAKRPGPPEARQVFPDLSVRNNILLGAHTRAQVDREAELEALLKRFPRLRERLSSRAGLLSGGEQHMLAIARGLMAKPRILLLEEPSLGLAPAMINELFDMLAELRDDGVTILLVDQMAALAFSAADRGYVQESGCIVRNDSAIALAQEPALEAAYLDRAEAAQ